ncbi:hypothetical protein yrohd0001_33920 [Yersinia rohdei ATCC 43380]|nr:hypothetical protein yrohd0001_33920 [Yersinia rohdei ATCC 43380]
MRILPIYRAIACIDVIFVLQKCDRVEQKTKLVVNAYNFEISPVYWAKIELKCSGNASKLHNYAI